MRIRKKRTLIRHCFFSGSTVASQDVNFTLVPEVPFKLEGEGGFLSALTKRIINRKPAEWHGVQYWLQPASRRNLNSSLYVPSILNRKSKRITLGVQVQRTQKFVELKLIDNSKVQRTVTSFFVTVRYTFNYILWHFFYKNHRDAVASCFLLYCRQTKNYRLSTDSFFMFYYI